jgi:hypothetical protein
MGKVRFLKVQIYSMILGIFVHGSLLEHRSFHLKFKGEVLYKENMKGKDNGVLHFALFLIKYIKFLLRKDTG